MKSNTGRIWLVGAGPGDPGLLTRRGWEVLAAAEVVVYDRLAGPGVLALIPPDAEAIDVGKRAGSHPVPQEEINRILFEKAREGKRVVRLKGGDPFVFGRGGEELTLPAREGIPFEVVPGITSATAVPAYAGIPVTHRGLSGSFHVVTGHTRMGEGPSIDYPALAALGGTLIFLMGVSSLGGIAAGLLAAGMPPDTPAAVLESGTTARQRRVISTLQRLESDAGAVQIGSPAIIVVGEVCSFSEAFCWAESRPLAGIRVLIPLAGEDCFGFAERFGALGAETAELSVLNWRPPENSDVLREVLHRLPEFRWILFDRPSCVHAFFQALFDAGMDARALAGRKLAVEDSASEKALLAYGLRPDFVLNAREAFPLEGECLVLCAENAPDVCGEYLAVRRLPFKKVAACHLIFRRESPLPLADFLAEETDFAVFSGREAAEGFFQLAGQRPFAGKNALCIGAEAASLARAAGMRVLTADVFREEYPGVFFPFFC